MRTLSAYDYRSACITGLTAGLLGWGVLSFLDRSFVFGLNPAWLVLIIPVLWVCGIQLGYFLGRWFGFFNQFGKYVAIGFTNFAVDAGVFNFLLSLTHAPEGPLFVVQKSISFVVAVSHSYYWNRTWAFRTGTDAPQTSQDERRAEFTKFLAVNLLAMAVNVTVAFFVVHFFPRPDSFTLELWANVGGIAGAASALIFSFIGFKVVVFKKP